MPELTIALILLICGSLAIGAILGWILRAVRTEYQKVAINSEWHEQIDALRQSEQRVNRQRKELSAELAAVRTELETLKKTSQSDDQIKTMMMKSLSTGIGGATRSTNEAVSSSFDDNAEIERLQGELDEANLRRSSLRRELEKFIAKSQEIIAASREKDEKIFTLSRELESWQHRLPPLVEKYREIETENTIVAEQLEAERARTTELSETLRTRIMPSAWHQFENSGANSQAANTESPIDQSGTDNHHTAAANRTPPQRDDLKLIKGVGPALERTLNSLGIYRLAQIAAFDDSDIDRISMHLPQFPGRIRRDDWITQAKDLVQ